MPKKSKKTKKERKAEDKKVALKVDKERKKIQDKKDKNKKRIADEIAKILNKKNKRVIPAVVGQRSRANITEVVAPSGGRGGVGSYKTRRTPQQIKREKEVEARRLLGIKSGEKQVENLETPVGRPVRYNQTARTPVGGFTGLTSGYGVQSSQKIENKLDEAIDRIKNLEKIEKDSVDIPKPPKIDVVETKPLIQEIESKSNEILRSRIKRGVEETQQRKKDRAIIENTARERDEVELRQQKDLRDTISREERKRELEKKELDRALKEEKKEKQRESTQRRLSIIDEKKREEDKRVQDIRDELDRQTKAEEQLKKDKLKKQSSEKEDEIREPDRFIREQKTPDEVISEFEERNKSKSIFGTDARQQQLLGELETDEEDFEDEKEILKIQQQSKVVDDIMNGKKERTINITPEEEFYDVESFDVENVEKQLKRKDTVNRTNPPSSGRVSIIDDEPEDINIPTEPTQPFIDNTKIKEQIEKDKLFAQKIALEQARKKDIEIKRKELEDDEIRKKSKELTRSIIGTQLSLAQLRETPSTARQSGQGRKRGLRIEEGIVDIERGGDADKRELVEKRNRFLEENKQIIDELYNEYRIDGTVFPINIRDLNKVRNERSYVNFRNDIIKAIEAHRNIRYRTLRKKIINRMENFNRLRKEINKLNQKLK